MDISGLFIIYYINHFNNENATEPKVSLRSHIPIHNLSIYAYVLEKLLRLRYLKKEAKINWISWSFLRDFRQSQKLYWYFSSSLSQNYLTWRTSHFVAKHYRPTLVWYLFRSCWWNRRIPEDPTSLKNSRKCLIICL